MNRLVPASKLARVMLALVVALVLGAACNKELDLGTFTAQATSLVQKYTPEIKQLSARIPELVKRAGDIPDSVPGAAALKGALAKNQDVAAKLQGAITSLVEKVGSASKTGKADEVKKVIDTSTQEIDTGLTVLRTNLDAAASDLSRVEEAAKAAASERPAQAAASFERKLASGFEIKGAGDGIEGKLIAFIEDPAKAPDKSVWFNFDRLTFQTGKSELDLARSREQLTNIVEILKAYPAVALKLGGYTDNVGKPEDNQKLSQQRAEAVAAALVSAGIAKDRLSAEGYGAQFPECPTNDSDECRAKNRRIAVSVRAK